MKTTEKRNAFAKAWSELYSFGQAIKPGRTMERTITLEDIIKASNDMNAAIARWAQEDWGTPQADKAQAEMDYRISIYNLTIKIYEKQQHIHAGATA